MRRIRREARVHIGPSPSPRMCVKTDLVDAAVVVVEGGLTGIDGDGNGADGGQSHLQLLLVAGRSHVHEPFVLRRRFQSVVPAFVVLSTNIIT